MLLRALVAHGGSNNTRSLSKLLVKKLGFYLLLFFDPWTIYHATVCDLKLVLLDTNLSGGVAPTAKAGPESLLTSDDLVNWRLEPKQLQVVVRF